MTKLVAKQMALGKLKSYLKLPLKDRKIENINGKYGNFYAILNSLPNQCPLCYLFLVKKVRNYKICNGCPLTFPSCNDHFDKGIKANIAKLQVWQG